MDEEGNHLYTITSHQEQEGLLDIVTGMIQVFSFDVFLEQHLDPFSVFTHVENSILVERVYRDCTISRQSLEYHG